MTRHHSIETLVVLLLAGLVAACASAPAEPAAQGAAGAPPTAKAADLAPPADDDSPAPSAVPIDDAALEAPPWDRALLYRVEGSGGTVYLMGTFHLGVDYEVAPPEIAEAFAASTTFVMETDLSEAEAILVDYIDLPEGESISAQIGEERWARVLELNPGAGFLDDKKPWLINIMLVQQILPRSLFDTALDVALLEHAQREGYAIGYLESAESQLVMLDEIMDVDALIEFIDEYDQERMRVIEMRVAFSAGDLDALDGWLREGVETERDRQNLARLLDLRNEAWIPVIEGYMAEEGVDFIAFGAGHLSGEKGVIALLEANGHIVERVPAGR